MPKFFEVAAPPIGYVLDSDVPIWKRRTQVGFARLALKEIFEYDINVLNRVVNVVYRLEKNDELSGVQKKKKAINKIRIVVRKAKLRMPSRSTLNLVVELSKVLVDTETRRKT